MTADEYLALGETPERYELIEGVVVMSPSPTPRHQRAIFLLLRELGRFDPDSTRVEVFHDTDLKLDRGRVYRPNVSVYRRECIPTVPGRPTTPPDLVIEVLSPGSKPLDLVTKREDYESFGVEEYWVIDPDGGTVRAWRRERERFVETPAIDDRLESRAIEGFVLDLAPVRALSG